MTFAVTLQSAGDESASRSTLAGNPRWRAFLGSLERNDYFQVFQPFMRRSFTDTSPSTCIRTRYSMLKQEQCSVNQRPRGVQNEEISWYFWCRAT